VFRQWRDGRNETHIGSLILKLARNATSTASELKNRLCTPNVEGSTNTRNDPYIVATTLQQMAFASGVIKDTPIHGEGNPLFNRTTRWSFWVHKGTVEVTIHDTVVVLNEMDTFFVPQGNTYNIEYHQPVMPS